MKILGKTVYMTKISMPIITGLAAAVIFLLTFLENDPIITVMFYLFVVMLAGLFILSILMPKNAVLYDEERKTLVLRCVSRSMFSFASKEEIPLDQITGVEGIRQIISPLVFFGWIHLQNFQAGLFIKIGNRTVKMRFVQEADIVAKRINALLVQHKY